MFGSGDFADKSPSWFLGMLKLPSFYWGHFKIFKNGLGQFIPNLPLKQVITSGKNFHISTLQDLQRTSASLPAENSRMFKSNQRYRKEMKTPAYEDVTSNTKLFPHRKVIVLWFVIFKNKAQILIPPLRLPQGRFWLLLSCVLYFQLYAIN